jgi:sugar/nucleoside kinase (ribokinase family)
LSIAAPPLPVEEQDDAELYAPEGSSPRPLPHAEKARRGPDAPRVLIVDAGTTALDAKYEEDLHGDPLTGTVGTVRPDGMVTMVGPDGRIQETGEHFEEPDLKKAKLLVAGGIANAANAMARLLANESAAQQQGMATISHSRRGIRGRVWAVMARLGDDEAGERYFSMIHPDVNTSLIEIIPGGKSGLSHVRLQPETRGGIEEGTYAIRFRPGESGQWMPTEEEAERIAALGPFNVNISYPGLFPFGMDRDNGATLSTFVRRLQRFCPMVSMDMHGPTLMRHVEPALSHIDAFNASYRDATRIFLGRDVKSIPPEQRDDTLRLIDTRIRMFMSQPMGRSRLFTVTHRNGCYLVFQTAAGEIHSQHCLSPCAQIPAKDTTGAGDVRFATSRLYLAREKGKAWREGTVTFDDVCRAVDIGQVSTTLHLQGEGGKAYGGVTMAKMEAIVRSGQTFSSLEELRAALLTA